MITIKQIEDTLDVLAVEDLAAAFHEEHPMKYAFDAQHIRKQATLCAVKVDRSSQNCWVAYDNGTPIGFLVAHAAPMLWSKELHAYQDIWYILPSHRGGRASLLLLKEYERWATELGASRLTLTVALYNKDDVERVSKLFDRLGYAKAGYYHVKEL